MDRVGNVEAGRTVRVRVDLTAPGISGMPAQPCRLWPPDGRMVPVADVVGTDDFSGVGELEVEVGVDEPAAGDVTIDGGLVRLRAERAGRGDGRVYTIAATVSDVAGNVSTSVGTCEVPHDRRP